MAEPTEVTFVFIENFCGCETERQVPFDGKLKLTLNETSDEARAIRAIVAELLRKQGEIMRGGVFGPATKRRNRG